MSVSKWNNEVAEWDSPHELINNVVKMMAFKYIRGSKLHGSGNNVFDILFIDSQSN